MMQSMSSVYSIVSALIFLTFPILGISQTWETELRGGGHIRVDPKTNRGTIVTRGGAKTQLWDGVHRLQDGTEITVRSGVVVPNREILDVRKQLPRYTFVEDEQGATICVRLMRKVCGLLSECADQPGCVQARQLVQFEKEEREDQTPGFDQAPQQCQEALEKEGFFKPCQSDPTPCQQLVSKVCGVNNECGSTETCDASRQLLEMEAEERLTAPDPAAAEISSRQCEAALGNEDFFRGCGLR